MPRGRPIALVLLPLALAGPVHAATATIYDLPAQFRDETGTPAMFGQWRGRRLAVTMGYTSCQRTCPRLTMKLLRQLEERYAAANEPIDFVVVSLDPKTDTPAVLAAYKQRHGITSPHWHFLTGSIADTERVARELGSAFLEPETHIFHSFKVVVFAPTGEVEHTFDWDHRDVGVAR